MNNIPEGFKLVPVVPTEHQMKIARSMTMQQEQTVGAEYRAMVKAAPAPPQPIYDETKERELFEAYASTYYRLQELPLDFDDGEYIEPEVQYSWESWEARAKSVEVGDE